MRRGGIGHDVAHGRQLHGEAARGRDAHGQGPDDGLGVGGQGQARTGFEVRVAHQGLDAVGDDVGRHGHAHGPAARAGHAHGDGVDLRGVRGVEGHGPAGVDETAVEVRALDGGAGGVGDDVGRQGQEHRRRARGGHAHGQAQDLGGVVRLQVQGGAGDDVGGDDVAGRGAGHDVGADQGAHGHRAGAGHGDGGRADQARSLGVQGHRARRRGHGGAVGDGRQGRVGDDVAESRGAHGHGTGPGHAHGQGDDAGAHVAGQGDVARVGGDRGAADLGRDRVGDHVARQGRVHGHGARGRHADVHGQDVGAQVDGRTVDGVIETLRVLRRDQPVGDQARVEVCGRQEDVVRRHDRGAGNGCLGAVGDRVAQGRDLHGRGAGTGHADGQGVDARRGRGVQGQGGSARDLGIADGRVHVVGNHVDRRAHAHGRAAGTGHAEGQGVDDGGVRGVQGDGAVRDDRGRFLDGRRGAVGDDVP